MYITSNRSTRQLCLKVILHFTLNKIAGRKMQLCTPFDSQKKGVELFLSLFWYRLEEGIKHWLADSRGLWLEIPLKQMFILSIAYSSKQQTNGSNRFHFWHNRTYAISNLAQRVYILLLSGYYGRKGLRNHLFLDSLIIPLN